MMQQQMMQPVHQRPIIKQSNIDIDIDEYVQINDIPVEQGQNMQNMQNITEHNKVSVPLINGLGRYNPDEEQNEVPVPLINGLGRYNKKQNQMMQQQNQKSNDDKNADKLANKLANMLDNVLDKNMNVDAEPKNKESYSEFGQNANNSNVIMNIYPKDKNNANFNKETHPDEIYITVMQHGKTNELKASDIHEYSLETHKHIYKYNNDNDSIYKSVYKNKSPTGFIYARCSTTNDISIETQRQSCFDYAKSKGIRLLSFGYQYDNNVSARNMNNLNFELGFWEKQIPDGGDMIIYSVDRLSRNLLKGIQFLERLSASRGINIHFVTNEIIYNVNVSAAAKSMIQQELQTAEKYSNMTSEKIKGTLKRLRQEGHVFGRAPYGYKHVKIHNIRKRVINNQERENIRKIKNRYNNYRTSFENFPENVGIKKSNMSIIRQLVRWCNRTGLKYRNNKNYTIQQIKYIVNLNLQTSRIINNIINNRNSNSNSNSNNNGNDNNNLEIDMNMDIDENQDIQDV